jgi:hypothetical protein
MKQLFIELGLEEYKFENNGKFLPTLESGSVIQSKYYKWLKRKDIDFKPDLVITKSEFWESEKNNPPVSDEAIIIESKLFKAQLTKKQETNYKRFKQEFSKINGNKNKIQMILISIKDYKEKEKPDLFDKALTWAEVIEKSDEIINNLKTQQNTKEILNCLVDFMKVQIVPPKVDLFKANRPCSKKILSKLKKMISLQEIKPHIESIGILGPKKLMEYYDKESDYSEILKTFKNEDLKNDDRVSHIEFSTKKDEFYFFFNCSTKKEKAIFWIEFYERPEIIPIGIIDFESGNWEDEWYKILETANKEIHKIKWK